MFRWLLFTALLCGGVYAALALTSRARSTSPGDTDDGPALSASSRGLANGPGYLLVADPARRDARLVEVNDARITIIDKVDIPSEREGKLLFIGTEFKPGERKPEGRELDLKILEGKVYKQDMLFLAIKLEPNEPMPQGEEPLHDKVDGKQVNYRRWKETDGLPAGKLRVFRESRLFRKLEVGERLEAGDLVALVNPALALDDLLVKAAKLDVAYAENLASEKTRDEAYRRFLRDKELAKTNKQFIPEDELKASELNWHRYTEEAKAKAAAIVSAQQELNQTITVLKMHQIRCIVPGTIRMFYKNTGDAVKLHEPVLQMQNIDRLRAEGLMEVQNSYKLRSMMEGLKPRETGKSVPVEVEVTRPDSPVATLSGHEREVNCVAVSRGDRPVIISGDEGGGLRGWGVAHDPNAPTWEADKVQLRWVMRHGSAVRALACTPTGAAANEILVGLADGSAYLVPLENDVPNKGKARLLAKHDGDRALPCHSGPIGCAAFSPDGTLCATGGQDRKILVWSTDNTDKELYEIADAHHGPVTALHFLSGSELVSVGKDEVLVWTLETGKKPQPRTLINHRGNTVPVLGVDRHDPNDPRLLVDQGREVRLYSMTNPGIKGTLRIAGGSGTFSTMALFSPDGRTILTNNASENKVQMWRAPQQEGERPYAQRQLIWTKGTTTCGAFGGRAKDNFAVTGTQDGKVLLWALPGAEERRLSATLTFVERALDANDEKVHVGANLAESAPWVIPGSTATMVIRLDDAGK